MSTVEILDFSEDGDLWVVYPFEHYPDELVRELLKAHLAAIGVLEGFLDGDPAAEVFADLTIAQVYGVHDTECGDDDLEVPVWFQTSSAHPRRKAWPMTVATWEPAFYRLLGGLPAVATVSEQTAKLAGESVPTAAVDDLAPDPRDRRKRTVGGRP